MTEATSTATNLRVKDTGSACIGKWLWVTHIFKTRTLTADTCKDDRMSVNGMNVKPSHVIKPGKTIDAKKPFITYPLRVIKTVGQRAGARLIPQIYENVADTKQCELLEMSRISGFTDRTRGTSCPMKKDCRSMDAFVHPALFGWDEGDERDEGDDSNQQ